MKSHNILILFIVIFMAVLRLLLTDAANVAPIAAIGLFAVYYFRKTSWALVLSVGALFVSDILLNRQMGYGFHWSRTIDYAAFAFIIIAAFYVFEKYRKPGHIALTAVGGSLLFFVVSNFGVWLAGINCPQTVEGLAQCYIQAVPFYRGTLVGDLLFTGLFFGLFETAKTLWPALRWSKS